MDINSMAMSTSKGDTFGTDLYLQSFITAPSRLLGKAIAVNSAGTAAYALGNASGQMLVANISNVNNLTQYQWITFTGLTNVLDFFMYGNMLWACRDRELASIYIANPASAVQKAINYRYPELASCKSFTINGSYIYAGYTSGISVYQLNNSTGVTSYVSANNAPAGQSRTMVHDGNTTLFSTGDNGYFEATNTSNPSSIALLDSIAIGGSGQGLALNDDMSVAFVTSPNLKAVIAYNISNHANITEISRFVDSTNLAGNPAKCVYKNNVLFVTGVNNTYLVSIDVSDTSNMSILSSATASGIMSTDVVLVGDSAVVCTEYKIAAVNIK